MFSHRPAESRAWMSSNTLLFRAAGPRVGVVLADGTVQVRCVTLGRDFGKTSEILASVSPADSVILNPSDALADGASVRDRRTDRLAYSRVIAVLLWSLRRHTEIGHIQHRRIRERPPF